MGELSSYDRDNITNKVKKILFFYRKSLLTSDLDQLFSVIIMFIMIVVTIIIISHLNMSDPGPFFKVEITK